MLASMIKSVYCNLSTTNKRKEKVPNNLSINHPMKGIFRFIGTHGIPIDIVVLYVQKQNSVIDWDDFFTDALRDGAKLKSVSAKVLTAILEVYGKEYAIGFQKSLRLYLYNKFNHQLKGITL